MKALHHLSFAVGFSFVIAIGSVNAQVGDDNPTGPTGIFNGIVTTGGAYDPYTGNARRVVTDIVIAGAVGTHPLALTRTSNSRSGLSYFFGMGGSWRHNYEWYMPESEESQDPNFQPSYYTVDFPDGRVETFTYSASDVYYRGPLGVRQRFIPINISTLLAYLVLEDGSKVEFKGTKWSYFDPDRIPHTIYYYSYVAQALIDPNGLRTTFTRNADGTLQKVTEPAGRHISFTYGTVGNGTRVIDHVTGSDGRTVQYYYVSSATPPGTAVYVKLDHIVYFGNAQWTATYKYQAPNVGDVNWFPLLSKCDDPMYEGPMNRIAYTYKTGTNPDGTAAVLGQIQSENYYDGTSVGAAVSTLSIDSWQIHTETRPADNKTRSFVYNGTGFITYVHDWQGHAAWQTYDANKFPNQISDFNGNATDLTRNFYNGGVESETFPATPDDAPAGRGSVTIKYGWSGCADTNNRDATNPYFVCTTTDEGGHVTSFTRDANKRVTRIDYPDGGYETFTYNSFGEVLSHRLTTGGTESFTYDATGLKLTYRNPSNASGNPTARYQYDSLGRIAGTTDALGASSGDPAHTTGYAYNSRGQLTVITLPTDPNDGIRHTINNWYNGDGTLQYTINQLNQVTSYTYDDYRRLRTKTTPLRFAGDNTPRTTNLYYDANGTGDDYGYTDASVTYLVLPSGKKSKTIYDENRRKISVTAAYGTADAATTSYGYDNVGNVTSVVAPNQQSGQQYAGKSATTGYDERNRVWWVKDALFNQTTFAYDSAGHKKSVTRPNGQTITYDSYDAMNRLLQQTAKQTSTLNAITKYTYTTAGLLATMQDPRLVALSSTYKYTYTYDTTGRKTKVTYPPDSLSVQRTETWSYDAAGRVATFKNRAGKTQTFTYDALNRMSGFTWNDGLTPSASFGYDAASRLIEADNANAWIPYVYYNDNLLKSETEHINGSSHWGTPITYSYDGDGNRIQDVWPDGGEVMTYTYTNRNQMASRSWDGILDATYAYDVNGNLATRVASTTPSTTSTYTYDALDRVTHISHDLVGGSRTFDYDYDSVGNRKWTKRDGGTGDVFGYDYAEQANAVKLDIANPDTTAVGSPTIIYDANGNRTSFSPYGSTDTYTINNLNQYTQRNTATATYDLNGNLTTGVDGSTYSYDAQNRLISASKGGVTETFKYDALNRMVSRTTNGVPTYNIWDGWDLIITYDSLNHWKHAYLNGPGGMLIDFNATTGFFAYNYGDASGSTTHIADSTTGALVEWYRYDLQGTPVVYDASNNVRTGGSAYDPRFLFTGQQWDKDLGLYDLRNRFYSPDIGRFLSADPTGFDGDPTNLYRYCANNPSNMADPLGLYGIITQHGNRIDIKVPIYFTSNGSGTPMPTQMQVDTFIRGVNTYLSGPFGGYILSTTVQQITGWAVLVTGNTVHVIDGKGSSFYVNGTNTVRYYAGGSNGQSPEYTAAHETLHLLGLGDMYTLGGNGEVQPKTGYENNIMGGTGGTEITPEQVQQIINNSGPHAANVVHGLVMRGVLKPALGSHGPLIPFSYSPSFGFSQGTNGSVGGFPEFGPSGGNALGGEFSPGVLGDLGLGGGSGVNSITMRSL